MGDSITAFWPLPSTNFGVPGETTSQMLSRFDHDVVGRGYNRVVILGGTNDARLGQSKHTIDNLASMTAAATKAGMVVVMCTIPPEYGVSQSHNPTIQILNSGIEQLAAKNNYKLADYFSSMVGHPEYLPDGVHPNEAGYAVMQNVLTKQIQLFQQ